MSNADQAMGLPDKSGTVGPGTRPGYVGGMLPASGVIPMTKPCMPQLAPDGADACCGSSSSPGVFKPGMCMPAGKALYDGMWPLCVETTGISKPGPVLLAAALPVGSADGRGYILGAADNRRTPRSFTISTSLFACLIIILGS